jgi:replicative DNA helicase
VIQDKFLMRQVQELGNFAFDAANEQQLDGARITLNAMMERIDELQSQVKATESHSLASVAVELWNRVLEERKRDSKIVGIPTGVDSLDDTTTGWRDGELTYIGALPGRGKTAFMLQAFIAALKSGVPAGYISLEMTREQLLRRIALAESRIAPYKWRDVRLMSPTDLLNAREATFKLGELEGQIADAANMSPVEISALARRWYRVHGVRIVFVDFVQIIREEGRDRREAINRVSAILRDTCKSLRIPFVVASQLARRDNDPHPRPTLQDLRESGNLEQDAHNVLMLYRPREADEENGGLRWTGEDEIIVEKSREGGMGSVKVRFNENELRFDSRRELQ